MAKAAAETIMAMGINVYFDEYDKDLKAAVVSNSHSGLVSCIDKGISLSTHLLGIITRNTYKSWWVPYEIGGAHGQKKKCAHLIRKTVSNLPSYIRIAPILIDFVALRKWLNPIAPTLMSSILVEASVQEMKKSKELLKYLPASRDKNQINYY